MPFRIFNSIYISFRFFNEIDKRSKDKVVVYDFAKS